VARFFGGIGIGIASGLSPMYIAEVAPSEIRGKLVSLNQMTIVLGILAAQIVNWLIAEPIPADFSSADIAASWNGQMAWRWMFCAKLLSMLMKLSLRQQGYALPLTNFSLWLSKTALSRSKPLKTISFYANFLINIQKTLINIEMSPLCFPMCNAIL